MAINVLGCSSAENGTNNINRDYGCTSPDSGQWPDACQYCKAGTGWWEWNTYPGEYGDAPEFSSCCISSYPDFQNGGPDWYGAHYDNGYPATSPMAHAKFQLQLKYKWNDGVDKETGWIIQPSIPGLGTGGYIGWDVGDGGHCVDTEYANKKDCLKAAGVGIINMQNVWLSKSPYDIPVVAAFRDWNQLSNLDEFGCKKSAFGFDCDPGTCCSNLAGMYPIFRSTNYADNVVPPLYYQYGIGYDNCTYYDGWGYFGDCGFQSSALNDDQYSRYPKLAADGTIHYDFTIKSGAVTSTNYKFMMWDPVTHSYYNIGCESLGNTDYWITGNNPDDGDIPVVQITIDLDNASGSADTISGCTDGDGQACNYNPCASTPCNGGTDNDCCTYIVTDSTNFNCGDCIADSADDILLEYFQDIDDDGVPCVDSSSTYICPDNTDSISDLISGDTPYTQGGKCVVSPAIADNNLGNPQCTPGGSGNSFCVSAGLLDGGFYDTCSQLTFESGDACDCSSNIIDTCGECDGDAVLGDLWWGIVTNTYYNTPGGICYCGDGSSLIDDDGELMADNETTCTDGESWVSGICGNLDVGVWIPNSKSDCESDNGAGNCFHHDCNWMTSAAYDCSCNCNGELVINSCGECTTSGQNNYLHWCYIDNDGDGDGSGSVGDGFGRWCCEHGRGGIGTHYAFSGTLPDPAGCELLETNICPNMDGKNYSNNNEDNPITCTQSGGACEDEYFISVATCKTCGGHASNTCDEENCEDSNNTDDCASDVWDVCEDCVSTHSNCLLGHNNECAADMYHIVLYDQCGVLREAQCDVTESPPNINYSLFYSAELGGNFTNPNPCSRCGNDHLYPTNPLWNTTCLDCYPQACPTTGTFDEVLVFPTLLDCYGYDSSGIEHSSHCCKQDEMNINDGRGECGLCDGFISELIGTRLWKDQDGDNQSGYEGSYIGFPDQGYCKKDSDGNYDLGWTANGGTGTPPNPEAADVGESNPLVECISCKCIGTEYDEVILCGADVDGCTGDGKSIICVDDSMPTCSTNHTDDCGICCNPNLTLCLSGGSLGDYYGTTAECATDADCTLCKDNVTGSPDSIGAPDPYNVCPGNSTSNYESELLDIAANLRPCGCLNQGCTCINSEGYYPLNWYLDIDGDGYGHTIGVCSCGDETDVSSINTDDVCIDVDDPVCDDGNIGVWTWEPKLWQCNDTHDCNCLVNTGSDPDDLLHCINNQYDNYFCCQYPNHCIIELEDVEAAECTFGVCKSCGYKDYVVNKLSSDQSCFLLSMDTVDLMGISTASYNYIINYQDTINIKFNLTLDFPDQGDAWADDFGQTATVAIRRGENIVAGPTDLTVVTIDNDIQQYFIDEFHGTITTEGSYTVEFKYPKNCTSDTCISYHTKEFTLSAGSAGCTSEAAGPCNYKVSYTHACSNSSHDCCIAKSIWASDNDCDSMGCCADGVDDEFGGYSEYCRDGDGGFDGYTGQHPTLGVPIPSANLSFDIGHEFLGTEAFIYPDAKSNNAYCWHKEGTTNNRYLGTNEIGTGDDGLIPPAGIGVCSCDDGTDVSLIITEPECIDVATPVCGGGEVPGVWTWETFPEDWVDSKSCWKYEGDIVDPMSYDISSDQSTGWILISDCSDSGVLFEAKCRHCPYVETTSIDQCIGDTSAEACGCTSNAWDDCGTCMDPQCKPKTNYQGEDEFCEVNAGALCTSENINPSNGLFYTNEASVNCPAGELVTNINWNKACTGCKSEHSYNYNSNIPYQHSCKGLGGTATGGSYNKLFNFSHSCKGHCSNDNKTSCWKTEDCVWNDIDLGNCVYDPAETGNQASDCCCDFYGGCVDPRSPNYNHHGGDGGFGGSCHNGVCTMDCADNLAVDCIFSSSTDTGIFLQNIVTNTDTYFVLDKVYTLNPYSYLKIDDEIVVIIGVDGGGVTVNRGMVGTTPASHDGDTVILEEIGNCSNTCCTTYEVYACTDIEASNYYCYGSTARTWDETRCHVTGEGEDATHDLPAEIKSCNQTSYGIGMLAQADDYPGECGYQEFPMKKGDTAPNKIYESGNIINFQAQASGKFPYNDCTILSSVASPYNPVKSIDAYLNYLPAVHITKNKNRSGR